MMLNIFYGREKIDKEKFIYEKIAEKHARTLVIVPDQYTLEAEKQAFRLLNVRGMMDVEIVSMSRLGYKLLAELGGNRRTFIDKYGRQMLLTKIANAHEEQFNVFKAAMRKNSFIEMANNFISEMKQYEARPEDIREIEESLEENSLLRNKLSDLRILYEEYEKKIDGKYTDSEDYIDLYMDKIHKSEIINGSSIWIYGFDSFAPKAMHVIRNLIATADEVNVFLTYDKFCRDEDIFKLSAIVADRLKKSAEAVGSSTAVSKVSDDYTTEKNSHAIEVIEQEIYAVGRNTEINCDGITVVQAANMYYEAESAASYILHLVRDKGMRYRDIVVICNDQSMRASIIKRVFDEYGINVFDDRKRSILSSPIAVFALSLLTVMESRYSTSEIFKSLKTGFTDLSEEEIEKLENYTIKYRIKGRMWKKPFVKGMREYGDEGLAEINRIRENVVSVFEPLEQITKGVGTISDFVESYYDYLTEQLKTGEKISELMSKQEAAGLSELATETGQVWAAIMSLFDQINELMGDEKFNISIFADSLKAGLSQLEIGTLPPTMDDILMGTMQRTRCGNIKALLIIGANEGLIPANSGDEGLFSIEELEYLADNDYEICKVDRIRQMEEKLAIYRNLSKPTDYLWISYSASDSEGKEVRPSELIDSIQRIFPKLEVKKDVVNEGDILQLLGGKVNTLRHLTEAVRIAQKEEYIAPEWDAVAKWFQEKDGRQIQKLKNGFEFENIQKPIEPQMTEKLYQREDESVFSISPSRLEKFSRCPFAHFVLYGLKPEERRIFEASGREIGDIYHRCLMEISDELTRSKRWDEITRDECKKYVYEIVRKQTDYYGEGVFHFGKAEEYKTSRIEEACYNVCWALIEQVRAGKIKSSRYEVGFGRGKDIKPIEIEINNKKVYIEGKIDRMDILENERVKIIDYKTGKEKFDIEEAKNGYRLQLMMYLKAAQEKDRKPAGVFYFLIDDPSVDITGLTEEKISAKITKEMQKNFRMNGLMIDDAAVIDEIAGEFGGYSDIVPIRKTKEGIKGNSEGVLISEEEFEELQEQIDYQIHNLCRNLIEGNIDISPKKSGNNAPCTYCEYSGICRFDLEFSGCRYIQVKKVK